MVQFYKRSVPTYTAFPNATYPDLYDNNKTTTDIQCGTVADVNNVQLFLADFTFPDSPTYGTSELVGGKIGLYTNSITAGTFGGTAGLKAFKLGTQLGDNEGGKDSAGTLLAVDNLVQISSHHEEFNLKEDFSGAIADDESLEVQGNTSVIKQVGPHLEQGDGYNYGQAFGGKSHIHTRTRKTHHNYYGQEVDGTKIYKIEMEKQDQTQWQSTKQHKHWSHPNRETWKINQVGTPGGATGSGFAGTTELHLVKYEKEIIIPPADMSSVSTVNRVSTVNSFLDVVKEEETLYTQGDDAQSVARAYADVGFSSEKVLEGGYSMHFNSLYPYRYSNSTEVFYPKRYTAAGAALDGSELQQISFVSKQLPIPTHLYSMRPHTSNVGVSGLQPVMPRIKIPINFDSLAPMLVRDQATEGRPNNDYRLNRSFVVTFGEEEPKANQNLYSYMLDHVPQSTGAGTDNYKGDGTGVSNKSFYGLAFAKYGGRIGTYILGNAGADGNNQTKVFTDVTWILDDTRAEVCFDSFPNTAHVGDYIGNWINLEIQMHPDHGGAYFVITNQDGEIESFADGEMVNAKISNIAVGSGAVQQVTRLVFGTTNTKSHLTNDYFSLYHSTDGSSTETKHVFWFNTGSESEPVVADASDYTQIDISAGGLTTDVHFATTTSTAINGHANFTGTNPTGGEANAANRLHAHVTNAPLLKAGLSTHLTVSVGQAGVDANAEPLGVSNLTAFPKWMTIWCNNYQAVKGGWNAEAQLYETGLKTTASGSGATTIIVKDDSTLNLDGINYKVGSGLKNPSYLLMDAGQNIVLAEADGSSAVDSRITENNNSRSDGKGTLTCTSTTWSSGDTIFYKASDTPDSQITTTGADLTMSVFVDSIQLSHFNISSKNATPNGNNPNRSPLSISSPAKLHATKWYGPRSSLALCNINEATSQHPSYLCFGFDSVSDFVGTKYILMNSFETSNAALTGAASDNLVTSNDSDVSNIRVGYTSCVEAYGRQGANSSVSTNPALSIDDESYVFSNNEGVPSFIYRGLEVGDVTAGSAPKPEFSVESTDPYNLDYFNQKGIMRLDWDVKASGSDHDRDVDSTANTDGVWTAGDTTVVTTNGDVFVKNEVIRVGSELMLVTDVNTSTEVLTVERGHDGTTDAEHADAQDIFRVAYPEKRESIFTSTRVLKIVNRNTLIVDNPSIFNLKDSEEYILYVYNDSHAAPTAGWPKTLKLSEINIEESSVTFGGLHGISRSNQHEILISPKKYWLMIEILNMGGGEVGLHGWQDETEGQQIYLPEKKYSSACMLTGLPDDSHSSYGATFNESLFNDGRDINTRNLEAFEDSPESDVILKDYGFGGFDKEEEGGGHLGFKALNIIGDVNKYNEIDISGAVKVDSLKAGDTCPVLIGVDDPEENFKINIDTETGTNKPYLTAIFEDEPPKVEDFLVKPHEEDAYNMEFSWSTSDDDIWYGFIMIDDKYIHSQYQNAVIYYPFNKSGPHGIKAAQPEDSISDLTTGIDATAGTGPFYDIEGLGGFCLRNNGTGTPTIEIGASGDPLADVTDEMSINFHFIHDLDADSTLANVEYLLYSSQKIQLWLSTDGRINYRQYWDTNSYVTLVSTSIIPMDGETPTNVMVTFDANLTHGNVKLFVNGKMEDLTSEVILADAAGDQTGWYYGQDIESNANNIHVGNQNDSAAFEFLGRFEELVIYNKCLYPVSPNDDKFIFNKDLKEVATSVSNTSSISYNARLFVKDYHNIRGYTSEEVGSSSNVSFKKAAFRFDNS